MSNKALIISQISNKLRVLKDIVEPEDYDIIKKSLIQARALGIAEGLDLAAKFSELHPRYRREFIKHLEEMK